MMETLLIMLGSSVALGVLLIYAYITELHYWLPSKRNQRDHGADDVKTETVSQPHSLDGSELDAD